MSRRAVLVIAFLAAMSMSGGAGAGVLLGRAADARQAAVRPDAGAPVAPASPRRPVATVPGGVGEPVTPRATGAAGKPAVLSARIAGRAPDGLLVWLDASEPLRDGVLRWGLGTGLDHADRIVGSITHGSVKLPLDGGVQVTVQASGHTADGRLVTSNPVVAPPA